MPAPQTPYDAVLHAARDVAKLDCALDAEMLGTALLGSVYSVAATDRATAVRDFVGRVPHRHHPPTYRVRDHDPRGLRGPGAGRGGRGRGAPGPQAPAWTAQLGRVRPTGCYAYGDVYGDQTSYLVTFAYDDTEQGGPEHAVVALVDHNIGITKDVFVGSPAERILGQVREMCADDELTWFREEDPAPPARRGRPAPGDHRRPERPPGRGLPGHRPRAGRGPAGAAAGGDRPAAGRAAAS